MVFVILTDYGFTTYKQLARFDTKKGVPTSFPVKLHDSIVVSVKLKLILSRDGPCINIAPCTADSNTLLPDDKRQVSTSLNSKFPQV